MKKSRILSAVLAAVLTFTLAADIGNAYADPPPSVLGWKGYFIDDGYDAFVNSEQGAEACWKFNDDNEIFFEDIYYEYENFYNPAEAEHNYTEATVRIPDSINGTEVKSIALSCDFMTFDLNPENKYMKCVDNVIFSKDGKILMSYAKHDKRKEYVLPDETETIKHMAFAMCDNLENIVISPNSKLKVIERDAFFLMDIKSITLPSFDIKIDSLAGRPQMYSYVQPSVSAEGNKLTWEPISNAAYYEVYQKLRSGEYRLLRRTSKTETVFDSLKSGYDYTFAVKAFAIIPALNHTNDREYNISTKYKIEGTMSEDVVLTGK